MLLKIGSHDLFSWNVPMMPNLFHMKSEIQKPVSVIGKMRSAHWIYSQDVSYYPLISSNYTT